MTGRAVHLRTTRGDRKSEIPEPFAGYGGSKRRDDRPRHHQTSEELLGVTMTKGWKIAVIAVVVGVVTYVGLELLLPHHKTEMKLAGLVSADSVSASTLKSPAEVAAAAAANTGAASADASATLPNGPAVAGET